MTAFVRRRLGAAPGVYMGPPGPVSAAAAAPEPPPPAIPDPYWPDVRVLANGEGLISTDASTNNLVLEPFGSISLSSDVPLFGFPTYKLQSDVTRASLGTSAPNDVISAIGTDPWTAEFWFYIPAAAELESASIQNGLITGVTFNGASQLIGTARVGPLLRETAPVAFARDAWHHFAVCRGPANTLRFFLNGGLFATVPCGSSDTNNPEFAYLYGTDAVEVWGAPVYFSNYRFTAYVARYTASFSRPTAPFPTFGP